VKALNKIHAGPRTADGKQVFPGYPAGGETGRGGWTGWILGTAPETSAQFQFGTQFARNMVFSDAAWDYKTFDVDRDVKLADKRMAEFLNSNDPSLKPFRARGGKLILYHGWSDAAIAPVNAINYYESVQKKMGSKDADSFVRLFMVPGMQHCGGGPGPNVFGQSGAGAPGDADHDIGAALEKWVEGGIAPEKMIATKYIGEKAESGVLRTRPLCAYPKIARYKGSGSTDDAASFECVLP
jgi:feruloyl esterase